MVLPALGEVRFKWRCQTGLSMEMWRKCGTVQFQIEGVQVLEWGRLVAQSDTSPASEQGTIVA